MAEPLDVSIRIATVEPSVSGLVDDHRADRESFYTQQEAIIDHRDHVPTNDAWDRAGPRIGDTNLWIEKVVSSSMVFRSCPLLRAIRT